MDFTLPSPAELNVGQRALFTVARQRGELDEHALALLNATHRLLRQDRPDRPDRLSDALDIAALTAITPEELAAAELRPGVRFQLVGALTVMAMASGEVGPAAAQTVAAFASALEIDSSAVANLTRISTGHFLSARLDIIRRQWAPKKLKEVAARDGFGVIPKAVLSVLGVSTDPALAARYIELGQLAPGTLGRGYFDYMMRNELPFPGERGSPPEVILFHDMTHVLSGYDTSPEEEILAASFSAGYSTYEVHNWLSFVLSQFQLGLQTAPGVPPARLKMDPERLIIALRRGAAMNVDLNEGWEYWDVIEEPVEALRERYNILPESAFGGRAD